MRAVHLVVSISALVAALVVLVACALLLVAVLHLDAEIQNLGSAPAPSGGFLIP